MNSAPNCPCDVLVHPQALSIDAGLSNLPRQIATFSEFRHAMLSALPAKAPLAAFRARGDLDLGVMLIEMWAYVCDLVAFYDETIAHEAYLRTARLSPSLRMLVSLLGYRPRPAVAATARLAMKVDGRQPLLLPSGLAFRSAAFGSEPPQVFELNAATRVHPLLNGWTLEPTRPISVATGSDSLLLAVDGARARRGDHLLLESSGALVAGVYTAKAVATIISNDGGRYSRVDLDSPLASPVTLAGSRVLRPVAATALWTNPSDSSSPLATASTSLILSGLVPQIKAGDSIIASANGVVRVFSVTRVSQTLRQLAAGTSFGSGAAAVSTPAVRTPATLLNISPAWPAELGTDATAVSIEYNLQEAGSLTAELDARIQPSAVLSLQRPAEAPPDGSQPGAFLYLDADGNGGELSGGVDFATRVLTPTQGSGLASALVPPSTIYANIVTVSRGESVHGEVLGFGDASVPNQSFKLKKKPLTHLYAPTQDDANGVANTLRLWVQDIEWQQVPSFFGIGPDAPVFIVRQNDDAESTVTFGDGIRGARLPGGAQVVANYRFGAGRASPPAGTLVQMAKPVKGISSVRNPVAAVGGDDAQPAEQVRRYAPRSALLFGRAVSIKDMEALAAGQPGVQAVQAGWGWDVSLQLPAVQLWYIGAPGLATSLAQSLRAATAPSTPIQALNAQPLTIDLVVDLRVNRRHQASVVLDAVIAALKADDTGLLSPQRIGIGAPLFRSRILAEVLAVDGVSTVTGLLWQGSVFDDYGKSPGTGAWFDISLAVNATDDQNG
jgi:hypothetical protein